jgi:hypothetical protein
LKNELQNILEGKSQVRYGYAKKSPLTLEEAREH